MIMFLKYLSLQIYVTENAEARKCVSTPYRGVGGSHHVRDIPINNQQEVVSSRHACKSVDVNAAPQKQTKTTVSDLHGHEILQSNETMTSGSLFCHHKCIKQRFPGSQICSQASFLM